MTAKPLPFPYPLPPVEPAWLTWNGGTVRRLAERLWAVFEARRREGGGIYVGVHAFDPEDLAVLADALEEAGCPHADWLAHLRNQNVPCPVCEGTGETFMLNDRTKTCGYCDGKKFRRDRMGHYSGCWAGDCWLLRHLLGKEQTLTARYLPRGCGDEQEVTVINPGACDGHCYLVGLEGSYSPPYWVVEAPYESEAEDEFVDSDFGKVVRVDPAYDPHNDDYGWQVHAGDTVGGVVVDFDGWLDLRGRRVEDPEHEHYRTEPHVTGGGTLYDADQVLIEDAPPKLRYFGPGLPAAGVRPWSFANRRECLQCGKEFYPEGGPKTWSLPDFCSDACARAEEEVTADGEA